MKLNIVKKLNIPKSPGCYFFINKSGKVIYIGKAANLKSRVFSYWSHSSKLARDKQKSSNLSPAKIKMVGEIKKIEWTETDSEIEALLLEANLIKKHQPVYNIDLRDDKRFNYIKVSLEDEIPGVFMTRKIDKSGKYFGPFTSASAVRETMKVIRKIWPYCTEKKQKNKPCFYYQINRCLGICAEKINRKEYLEKVINPIILFLSGQKKKIIKKQETKIKQLEKELKKIKTETEKFIKSEEELNRLKYQLLNMKKVLEHSNIIGVTEKYAADVVELAKVLALPRVPERIEGFDISNIFGHEAVGSMVVFFGGEANKSEYRKFKIKIGEGKASDTRMLKEVLERRFKHSKPHLVPPLVKGRGSTPGLSKEGGRGRSEWPLPDLIIIDGGKGQLNASRSIMKKLDLDLPLIAVSKGKGLRSSLAPDKIFFPGEKTPLVLPVASPAMHIIKRVRDEAHRFAIKYHRELRGKSLFKKK